MQRTPVGDTRFLNLSDLIKFLYEKKTYEETVLDVIRNTPLPAEEPSAPNEASLLNVATYAICSTDGNPDVLGILMKKLTEAGRVDWKDERDYYDEEEKSKERRKEQGEEIEFEFESVRNTALMIASEFGNLKVVKKLREEGASHRSKNLYGCTALFLAIERDHIEIVKYLAELDKDLIEKEKYNRNKYGKTLLIVATECASIKCAEFLIKKKNLDVNEQDSQDRIPLFFACLSNQKDIIDLLMDSKDANPELGPNTDPELGPNTDPELGPNTDPKLGPNTDPKLGPNTDPKLGPNTDPKLGLKKKEKKKYFARPLHWAAMYGSSHATKRILKFLGDKYLKKGKISEYMKIINSQDGLTKNTPLMHACKNGHYDVVKQLIEAGASRWIRKKEKVSKLHAYYDENNTIWTDENNSIWTNAFYMAMMNGHINIATDFFMKMTKYQKNVDDSVSSTVYQMYNKAPHDILTEDQLGTLALVYADTDALTALLEYAVKHDFHFNLFIELFKRFSYLNSILNIGLRKYFELLRNERIKDRERSDIDLTHKFTQILSELKQIQTSHPLEKLEAIQFYNIVNNMVDNLFECPTMSKVKAVEDSLCYLADIDTFMKDKNQNLMQIRDKHVRKSYAFREGPINISLDTNTTALFSSGQISIFIDHLFYNYLRKKSRRIGCCLCIETFFTRHLSHFLTGQMLEYCENIKKLKSDWINARYNPCIMFYLEGGSKLLVFLIAASICLGGSDWGYRAENGLILLTVMQLAYEYGELVSGGTTENHRGWPEIQQFVYYCDDLWNFFDLSGYILLLIWSFGNLHNRYGPDDKNETLMYITKPAISLSTIFLSTGLLRYFTVNESMGKLTIMLFAMIKDLLAFTILFTVCLFGFVITLYGLLHQVDFGACDGSGDPGCDKDPYFSNLVRSFITMFSATLGNFDLDIFYSDTPYRIEAQLVLITFMIVFAITLLSLLVARMSATHDTIDDNSTEVWQFQKARFTQSFLLIDEKNPLNMLPPPLNLLIVLFVPFHLIELWKIENYIDKEEIIWGSFLWGPLKIFAFIPLLYKKIKNYMGYSTSREKTETDDDHTETDYDHKHKASEKLTIWQGKVDFEKKQVLSICGTIADVTLGITFSFLAPLLELGSVALKLAQGGFVPANIFSFTALCLGYIVIYPIYVAALVYQSCHLRTLLTVHDRERNSIIKAKADKAQRNYLIHFDKERRLRDVSKDERPKDKAYLHIYVIKGENLRNMMDIKSTYTVRFILNGVVGCTDKCHVHQDAAARDQSEIDSTPIFWNNNHIYLPLDDLVDSGENTCYVSVVDDEGDEVAKSDKLPIMKWIQDSRYEGMIKITESQIGNDTATEMLKDGLIQVAIKITDPMSIPKHKLRFWNDTQTKKSSSNVAINSDAHSNIGVGLQLSRFLGLQLSRRGKISPEDESVTHQETGVKGEGVGNSINLEPPILKLYHEPTFELRKKCKELYKLSDSEVDIDEKILEPIDKDENDAKDFFMEEHGNLKGAPSMQFTDDELYDIFEPMVQEEKMTKKMVMKMNNDNGEREGEQ